ncbi:MAG: hypothetical protein ACN4E6_10350 [Qipengyuania pacifica]
MHPHIRNRFSLEEIVEGAVAQTLNTQYLLGEERDRNCMSTVQRALSVVT